jgi:DDE family transposase
MTAVSSPQTRRPRNRHCTKPGIAQRTYKKRAASIEPIFGQIKHNRKIRSVSRRGISAADSEWKLVTATHNVMKLWRLATTTA